MLHDDKMQLHPKKILLPVDFSPSSDAALKTATEFALHFQSQLVLLNIVPVIPIVSADEFSSCYFPQQEFLEESKKSVRTFGYVHSPSCRDGCAGHLPGRSRKRCCGKYHDGDRSGAHRHGCYFHT
jgi:universal stress protein family protein